MNRSRTAGRKAAGFGGSERSSEHVEADEPPRRSTSVLPDCTGKRLTGLFHVLDEKSIPRLVSRIQANSIARHQLDGDNPTSIIDDVTANPVELVCEAFAPVVRLAR